MALCKRTGSTEPDFVWVCAEEEEAEGSNEPDCVWVCAEEEEAMS